MNNCIVERNNYFVNKKVYSDERYYRIICKECSFDVIKLIVCNDNGSHIICYIDSLATLEKLWKNEIKNFLFNRIGNDDSNEIICHEENACASH